MQFFLKILENKLLFNDKILFIFITPLMSYIASWQFTFCLNFAHQVLLFFILLTHLNASYFSKHILKMLIFNSIVII